MFNCTTFHAYMCAVSAQLICTSSSVNGDNSSYFVGNVLKLFIFSVAAVY